jgi:hypothetical protein
MPTVTPSENAPADTTPPARPDLPIFDLFNRDENTIYANVARMPVRGWTEVGAVVSLYDGDTKIGESGTDESGNWNILSDALPDGHHQLSIIVTDAAGNASERSEPQSIDVKIHIDTPAAPRLAEGYESGSSDTDNITQVYNPGFSGRADPGSLIELWVNGTLVDAASADANGGWSMRLADQPDGIYQVWVVAHDTFGNVSPPSAPLTVTIDSTAPVAATPQLSSANDGATADGRLITHDTTQQITGVAEAGARVELYDTVSFTHVGSAVADSSGAWSVAAGLGEGEHDLVIILHDTAGNHAQSTPLRIAVDITAPQAPTIELLNGYGTGPTLRTNLAALTITGYAEANAKVALFDGDDKIGEAIAAENGSWQIVSDTLADGVHALSTTATDVSGHQSQASVVQLVDVKTHLDAPDAPDLLAESDSGRSDTDNITGHSSHYFTGSVPAGSWIELLVDGVVAQSSYPRADGTWAAYTPSLSDGEHAITLVLHDDYGNTSQASAPLLLTIDTVAPAVVDSVRLAPGSDAGHADDVAGALLTHVSNPVFTGHSEAGALVAIIDAYYDIVVGMAVADDNGIWSVNTIDREDGYYNLMFLSEDAAGNAVVGEVVHVMIDTQPAAALVGVAPQEVIVV